MCGIVGIHDCERRPVSVEMLRTMNTQLLHRGPDDEGYWIEDDVGLAMRRLAVIDVKGGRQPVSDEQENVIAVFNGEIYNFRQLRSDLSQRGHRFRTQADTEVIPHLYEEMGESFVNELDGMFAIALWDRVRRRLLLVRDRLGIKPLFYTEKDGRILFASELKALVAVDLDCQICKEAIYHYLTYGYIPAPLTVYQGIFKLLPGHMAVCSDRGIDVQRYWDVRPERVADRPIGAWLEELEGLLLGAVRSRMISDVPLGAFLSGGVDSSLVVALMSRCSGAPVRTFTVRFDEPSHDEAAHARRVADRFGTEHREFAVRPSVADHLEDIVRQFDEPFADASAIPMYFLSKLTRDHVTVALSGDGGDEVFGGYHRYVDFFRKRPLYRIPRFVRRNTFGLAGRLLPAGVRGKRFLRSLALDPLSDYVVGDDEINNWDLLAGDFLPRSSLVDTMDVAGPYIHACYPSELDALCMHDLKLYLPDDILTKVDRMSMAVSLEARVPLLDHRVVEFGFRLPANLRLRGRTGKYILKKLLARYMPESHVHREKHGFGIPLGTWFRGELRGLLNDALSPETIRRVGLFQPETVQRMLAMHMSGTRNFEAKLWRVLVAQIWWHHRSRALPAGRGGETRRRSGGPGRLCIPLGSQKHGGATRS